MRIGDSSISCTRDDNALRSIGLRVKNELAVKFARGVENIDFRQGGIRISRDFGEIKCVFEERLRGRVEEDGEAIDEQSEISASVGTKCIRICRVQLRDSVSRYDATVKCDHQSSVARLRTCCEHYSVEKIRVAIK